MIWYRKALGEYSKKTLISTGVLLAILLAMSVIQLMNGTQLEWKSISPVDKPDIFARVLYSALTFVTIGAFLYFIRFYQLLSLIYGRNRRGYREMKKFIWAILLLFMFFVLVPAGVDALNAVVSFLYNIVLFLVYVSPVVFLGTVVIVVAIVYRRLSSANR